MIEMRLCKQHGFTIYAVNKLKTGRIKYSCKECRREGIKKTRRKNKEILVKEFGGSCKRCGYNCYIGSLHFHHIDANDKINGVARISVGLEKMREEAKKCILLCANCHYEVESMPS